MWCMSSVRGCRECGEEGETAHSRCEASRSQSSVRAAPHVARSSSHCLNPQLAQRFPLLPLTAACRSIRAQLSSALLTERRREQGERGAAAALRHEQHQKCALRPDRTAVTVC